MLLLFFKIEFKVNDRLLVLVTMLGLFESWFGIKVYYDDYSVYRLKRCGPSVEMNNYHCNRKWWSLRCNVFDTVVYNIQQVDVDVSYLCCILYGNAITMTTPYQPATNDTYKSSWTIITYCVFNCWLLLPMLLRIQSILNFRKFVSMYVCFYVFYGRP